jgi:heterodisulfide reductase subunit D
MGYQTALWQTVQRTGVLRCLECGKCTAICPVSQHDHRFSPRRTVGRALMRRDASLLADDRLWACLTCLHCTQVCPAGVAYSELTLDVRTQAREMGRAVNCTHGEVIHAWMYLMMDPALKQERLGWLTERATTDDGKKLRTSDDSEVLFFVGCAPYFDVQFRHIGVDAGEVARATVRVLNALGIEPQVLADERCCGHDLLWEGNVEGFRQLAQLNADVIRDSGAKRIVTSCPECARALKVDYPGVGIDLGVEVLHLVELAAQGGRLRTAAPVLGQTANDAQPGHLSWATKVTFHDPCRLGRHLGVYDAPRQLLEVLGLELVEMPRHREHGLCCGTNGWTHCGAANKAIQIERLREAQATGADMLVTACIKCQIHFRCALQDRAMNAELGMEMKDLAEVLAKALARNGGLA